MKSISWSTFVKREIVVSFALSSMRNPSSIDISIKAPSQSCPVVFLVCFFTYGDAQHQTPDIQFLHALSQLLLCKEIREGFWPPSLHVWHVGHVILVLNPRRSNQNFFGFRWTRDRSFFGPRTCTWVECKCYPVPHCVAVGTKHAHLLVTVPCAH